MARARRPFEKSIQFAMWAEIFGIAGLLYTLVQFYQLHNGDEAVLTFASLNPLLTFILIAGCIMALLDIKIHTKSALIGFGLCIFAIILTFIIPAFL